jgi:hypothetical protein
MLVKIVKALPIALNFYIYEHSDELAIRSKSSRNRADCLQSSIVNCKSSMSDASYIGKV